MGNLTRLFKMRNEEKNKERERKKKEREIS